MKRLVIVTEKMDKDTGLGGQAKGFPATGLSMIARLGDEDPTSREAALASLVSVYWKPVYKYIRIRWRASNEDAKDWTQEFFLNAFERQHLRKYDASRARFRTYLRTCIDGFVANQLKSRTRLKRGGHLEGVPLKSEVGEAELGTVLRDASADPEEIFHREWVRRLFEMAVEDLRVRCQSSGREVLFIVFSRYDLDRPSDRLTYDELASELGIPATQVTNHLASARRQFREIVLERLRDVCASEAEFRSEARLLFGVGAV